MTPRLTTPTTADGLHAPLERLGFRQRSNGTYALDGLTLRPEDGWLTLAAARAEADADPLRNHLGWPGLWRYVPERTDRGRTQGRRVWEFPRAALGHLTDSDPGGEPGRPAVDAALSWALATAEGGVPDDWTPPDGREVESLLPPAGLCVRHASLMRQGRLVCDAQRLAVRMPVLPRLPDDLPPARRRCLETLLLDAQRRWRLVRLGFTETGGEPSVEAEVDLTGVPPALLEPLVTTGLEALRWVLTWLVRSADFVATTADMPCDTLDGPPSPFHQKGGEG